MTVSDFYLLKWCFNILIRLNSCTLGGLGGQITWGQEFKTNLTNMAKLCLYKKNTKISRLWWQVPVIPATWEAEAGRIAWIQEAEVAVSWDWATVLQPGWQSKTPSQKKKRIKWLNYLKHHRWHSACHGRGTQWLLAFSLKASFKIPPLFLNKKT